MGICGCVEISFTITRFLYSHSLPGLVVPRLPPGGCGDRCRYEEVQWEGCQFDEKRFSCPCKKRIWLGLEGVANSRYCIRWIHGVFGATPLPSIGCGRGRRAPTFAWQVRSPGTKGDMGSLYSLSFSWSVLC